MSNPVHSSSGLPVHALGRTDMQITRVGFGAWAIGGADWAYSWGAQDDETSIAAIRHAVARGLNWIDTAAIYGLGHSEDVVRKALADIPAADRPYIFTKGGLVWDDKNRQAQPRRVGEAASLRREVEASLRRLGVERIDLYQMHWPAQDTPLEDYWGTLVRLKEEGKLRAIGLSNHSVAELDRAEVIGHVDSLQPPFSAIRRLAAAGEIPWCAAHQTGVIVYSPMQSGLLTGRFTLARALSLGEDDWRSASPDFTGDDLVRNLTLASALKPVAERHDTTVAAVALAWTLVWPISGAIAGARSPTQVDGWIDAVKLELTVEDLDEIATAITTSGAGSGPIKP